MTWINPLTTNFAACEHNELNKQATVAGLFVGVVFNVNKIFE